MTEYRRKRHAKKRKRRNNSDSDDELDFLGLCQSGKIFSVKNEIHFNGEVTESSINFLIQTIQRVIQESQDREIPCYGLSPPNSPSITLFINSQGGSVLDTFRFIDYINILRQTNKISDLTTVLTGWCASCATILGIVGDVRLITKNAIAMIHEMQAGYGYSNVTKLRNFCMLDQLLEKKIVDLYSFQTQLPRKTIKKFMLEETCMSAPEYLKHGFVDDIYENVYDQAISLALNSFNDEEEEKEENEEEEKDDVKGKELKEEKKGEPKDNMKEEKKGEGNQEEDKEKEINEDDEETYVNNPRVFLSKDEDKPAPSSSLCFLPPPFKKQRLE